MNKKSVSITATGKKALEEELAKLIAERPEIIERIATARAFGDLSENEEYSSARNEQKFAENRILEIQEILKNASVIRNSARSKAALGAKVTILFNGKEKCYEIVGSIEADPSNNKISDISPLGKALIGHKAGESFDFNGKKVEVKSIQ